MEASESFTPEKNSVSFSAKSSDADLDVLEDYFKTNHPESLIKIENRKRDADGHLFNFSFQVKFAGDEKFFTRFDRTKDTPFVPNPLKMLTAGCSGCFPINGLLS